MSNLRGDVIINIDKIMNEHRIMLKELHCVNADFWKETVGEVHSQYNKIVYWILLYEDSDITLAHEKFCEIIHSHIKKITPLQIVISYNLIVGEQAFCVDRLKGNETIFSALTNGELGKNGFPLFEVPTIFNSSDSKREL